MSIESNIIRSNVQKTTEWSGGKTTELWIWPKESNYGERNFDCRISTAVVEVEESTFTLLPGHLRHLMILEGNLKLSHNNGEEITLEPYQVDVFDGGDQTVSRGLVRDFNVMLGAGYKATVKAFEVTVEAWEDLSYHSDFLHLIYCFKGTVQVQVEQQDKMQRHFLYEGDAFFLEGGAEETALKAFQMKSLKSEGIAIHVCIEKE